MNYLVYDLQRYAPEVTFLPAPCDTPVGGLQPETFYVAPRTVFPQTPAFGMRDDRWRADDRFTVQTE